MNYSAPKILFTPNTSLTRSIMAKANRTFSAVEFVLRWTMQVRNCSQYFLEHYPPSSPDVVALQNTIQSLLSIPTLPANVRETLWQAQDMLDPGLPGNIWAVLIEMRDVSEMVDEILGKFDWDVFWPVHSEQEILDLASNTTAQRQRGMTSVFAGKCSVQHTHTHTKGPLLPPSPHRCGVPQ